MPLICFDSLVVFIVVSNYLIWFNRHLAYEIRIYSNWLIIFDFKRNSNFSSFFFSFGTRRSRKRRVIPNVSHSYNRTFIWNRNELWIWNNIECVWSPKWKMTEFSVTLVVNWKQLVHIRWHSHTAISDKIQTNNGIHCHCKWKRIYTIHLTRTTAYGNQEVTWSMQCARNKLH